MITIEVNGREMEARKGETLLTVLRREGIDIPTLCHVEGLTPTGADRRAHQPTDARSGYSPSMLVLSRRVGERLIIGDDIVITVIDVRSDGVRIGIDAPRSVRVNRAEVLEAVKQANQEAARPADDAAALESLRALRPPTPPA